MEDGIKHMSNTYDDLSAGEDEEEEDEEEEERKIRKYKREEVARREWEKSCQSDQEESLQKQAQTLPGCEEENLHERALSKLPGREEDLPPERAQNLSGQEEEDLPPERAQNLSGQEEEEEDLPPERAHNLSGQEEEEEEEDLPPERAHNLSGQEENLPPDRAQNLSGQEESPHRLYFETMLEEERAASSTAAIEAMAMISRLQEEKATALMEARRCRCDAEERETHAREAMDLLKHVLLEKEEESRGLREHIEALYRRISHFMMISEYCDGSAEKIEGRRELVEMLLMEGNEEDSIRRGNELLLLLLVRLRLLMEKLGQKSHEKYVDSHDLMQNGAKKIEPSSSTVSMIFDHLKQLEERFVHYWQQHNQALDYEQIILNWMNSERDQCHDIDPLIRWTANSSSCEEEEEEEEELLLQNHSFNGKLYQLGSHPQDLSNCSPPYSNYIERVMINKDVEKNVMEQHRSSCPSIEDETNRDPSKEYMYSYIGGYYSMDIGTKGFDHGEENVSEGVHDVYEIQNGACNLTSFVDYQSNTNVEEDRLITRRDSKDDNGLLQIRTDKGFEEEGLEVILLPHKNRPLVDYRSAAIDSTKCSQIECYDIVDDGINSIYQLKERLKALEEERVTLEQVMDSLRKENRDLKLLQEIGQHSRDIKGNVRRRDKMEEQEQRRRRQPLFSSIFKSLFSFSGMERDSNGEATRCPSLQSSRDGFAKQERGGLFHLLNKPSEVLKSVCITRGHKVNLVSMCKNLRRLHP